MPVWPYLPEYFTLPSNSTINRHSCHTQSTTHRGVRRLQIGVIELLRTQPGLQETEGCLRLEVNGCLEHTPLRRQHPDAGDVADLEIASSALVLNDVADDSARAAVESGHVDPRQVQSPVVDGVRHHPARMADRDVVAERPNRCTCAEPVSVGVFERCPFVREDIGALAQAAPFTETHGCADVVDGAARREGFGTGEEAGLPGGRAQ